MKFEQFKHSLLARTDREGYINNNYILRINGSIVNYGYEKDNYIFIAYKDIKCSDNIYEFEVNDNRDYRIEWFVLESDNV